MSKPAIPISWAFTKLGRVTEYGRANKAEPNEIEDSAWVLELEDIEKNTSKLLARVSFADRQSKSTKNRFETGDVLYGKLRPYLNKVIIADNPGYCTTEIMPLKAGQHLDNRYLFYWLKHPTFLGYVEAESHGLNMPRLGTETGRAAPFILAPLNEQKRIADKLDAVLARVDACRDRLDRIPAILKRFRQSVLADATSGKLTENWREFHKIESGQNKKIKELITLNPKNNIRENIEVGFIPMSFMGTGFLEKPKFDTRQWHEVKTGYTQFSDGDVLLAKITPCFENGKGGIPSGLPNGWGAGSTEYFICRINPKLLKAQYLLAFFKTERFLKDGELEMTGSVGHKRVPKEYILESEIFLPSLDEQAEIVRRVESLFAYADRLEARYHAARAQVEKLTPALLAKSFRGELVPQDPNDEPASELLARIAATSTRSENKPKQRSGRKTKTHLVASME